MLVNRRVILIKEEVTQGTNSAPAVTDAILVENVAWSHVGARKVERQTIEATFGKRQSLYGGTLMQLTFTMEIKGTGFVDYVANPAPEIDVPIRICGNSAVATVTDKTGGRRCQQARYPRQSSFMMMVNYMSLLDAWEICQAS